MVGEQIKLYEKKGANDDLWEETNDEFMTIKQNEITNGIKA